MRFPFFWKTSVTNFSLIVISTELRSAMQAPLYIQYPFPGEGGGGAPTFQNYTSHLNILGARRLTRSKLHTADLQTFGDTVRSSVTTRNGALGKCTTVVLPSYYNQNWSVSATFINISQHKTSWKSAHWFLNCHTHIVRGTCGLYHANRRDENAPEKSYVDI
jgi:hypothetical protein